MEVFSMKRNFASALVFLLFAVSSSCFADMPSRWEKEEVDKTSQVKVWYDEGVKLVQEEKYDKALALFKKASQDDSNNAEVFNMLAYTQRKLGFLDEAFTNYHKALRIRPKFPDAREYLGETHIQAVLREIEILKSYGDDGKEELEDLVQALKEAAARIN
jgi:tetratricopeptide (TPR) repeat protein